MRALAFALLSHFSPPRILSLLSIVVEHYHYRHRSAAARIAAAAAIAIIIIVISTSSSSCLPTELIIVKDLSTSRHDQLPTSKLAAACYGQQTQVN